MFLKDPRNASSHFQNGSKLIILFIIFKSLLFREHRDLHDLQWYAFINIWFIFVTINFSYKSNINKGISKQFFGEIDILQINTKNKSMQTIFHTSLNLYLHLIFWDVWIWFNELTVWSYSLFSQLKNIFIHGLGEDDSLQYQFYNFWLIFHKYFNLKNLKKIVLSRIFRYLLFH